MSMSMHTHRPLALAGSQGSAYVTSEVKLAFVCYCTKKRPHTPLWSDTNLKRLTDSLAENFFSEKIGAYPNLHSRFYTITA